MTLHALSVDLQNTQPSDDEKAFISSASRRAEDFLQRNPGVTTLLSSDPIASCSGLRALRRLDILSGRRFCEWGSGIGTIAGLAALNGFDAIGIEIEPAFVAEARALCAERANTARFACGTFVCSDLADQFEVTGIFGATRWNVTPEQDAYRVLGTHPSEMDLVYAYPWPREIALYERLFDLSAKPGAVLWLYLHGKEPRVLLKG